MPKDIAAISVGDLAETVSNSVLNAIERRVNINKFIADRNAVIFEPIIRYGGRIILAQQGALAGFNVSGGGGVGNG